MARSILDNVDDGQESNSDKNGQPSPVSVLEPPFEEESPSSLEFKEITNDFHGSFPAPYLILTTCLLLCTLHSS
jgi:hypothetical protein